MVVKVSKPEINVREKLNELAPRTLTGDEYILNEHSHNGEYIKNGIAMYLDAGLPACFPHVSGNGSGQPAYNLDGYFPNLVNSGVTKSNDGNGSFAFAGNGHLQVTGQNNYNMYSSTCEAWFKSVGNATNGYHVIMQKNGGYSGAPAYGIRAGSNGSAAASAWFAHGSGINDYFGTGSFLPVVQQWYHMVSTVDADARILKSYINGELIDQNTGITAGGSYVSDQGFSIGIGDNRYLNGRIAVARVYNRPLSNGEIKYNYLKSVNRIYD